MSFLSLRVVTEVPDSSLNLRQQLDIEVYRFACQFLHGSIVVSLHQMSTHVWELLIKKYWFTVLLRTVL